MRIPNAYLLGAARDEEVRLERQIDEMAPITSIHLDGVGVERGQRIIDLGCGPGGALGVLACRVGETGSIFGLERNPRLVEAARGFVRERGLPNVEVQVGDAYGTNLPRHSFDGAHMRLVIVNVPAPELIVSEMMALVRPGGWVASMEPDFAAPFIDPPCAASEKLLAAFKALSEVLGSDLLIGRRLHRLFRAAGATDIRVTTTIEHYPPGHSRRANFLKLARAASKSMIERGLLDPSSVETLLAEFDEHVADPDVQVTSPLYYLLSGRAA